VDLQRTTGQERGDLVAAGGELSWPSAGSFESAYGEDLMAADTGSTTGP
jgi:hypothetical protein